MMRPVIPAVEALAADEQGALLGLILGGAGAPAAVRLGGRAGGRCAGALEAYAELSEAEAAAARATLVASLEAPVPAGVEQVHPGWLRRVLEGEPGAIIRAVTRGLPAEVGRVAEEILRGRGDDARAASPVPEGPALADLRRSLFAALAPMPTDATAGAMPLARALCARGPTALVDELDRRGAVTLGLALAGAPDAVVARAAAGVGEPLARVVMASAKGGADAEARALARALVAAVPATEAARGAARAVGLRVVAGELADEGGAALAAVAQRLPPVVGDALLAVAGDRGGARGA
jgi:hypothetical protein